MPIRDWKSVLNRFAIKRNFSVQFTCHAFAHLVVLQVPQPLEKEMLVPSED